MANYRAVANGNWSALATWQDDSSGSYVASTVLPGAADVVYANNFTVTLDINITVSQIRTTTATNVNAGGGFTFGAATTVTADVIAGTTTCLTHGLTTTKTVIGNVTGGLNNSAWGISSSSTGTLIVIGNVTGGTTGNAHGIANGSGVLNVTGNCIGAAGRAITNGAGTLTITGNITGGTSGYGTGISSNPGNVNLTGNTTGGNLAGNDQYGMESYGTTVIIGTAIGGASTNSGLRVRGGTATVTSCQAGNTGLGITADAGTSAVIQNMNLINTVGAMAYPISGNVRFSNTGPNTTTVLRSNGTTQTLVDGTTGFPATSNVRNGVSYASGTLTGTLVVPPANTVSVGVPVDNTVGTAANTPASFLAELSVSADPLAERLRNVATVQTTGDQIAAAL